MAKKKPANPIKDIDKIRDIQDYLRIRSKRNYVLFVLGISTGYRAGDLVKLQARDVREALKYGYFEILEGKKVNSKNIRKENIKARKVTIIRKLKKILQDYIANMEDYEFLFKSRKGTNCHITVAHVSRILQEAGSYFGLNNITAHSMRKTYAYTIYMENDKDIVAVKEMLGHSSPEITKRYLGLDREVYDRYSNILNKLIF